MIERHHIIFKSQGGLDYELNYKHLESEQHRGNNGPHENGMKRKDIIKRLMGGRFYL